MALRFLLLLAVGSHFSMLNAALPSDVIFEMIYRRPHPSPAHSPLPPAELGIDNPFGVSQQCLDAFNRTVNSTLHKLLNGSLSLTVPDSLGKPEAGILAGNINMLGHFDECENVTNFHYCLAYINISNYVASPFPLMYGLCSPKGCSDYDVTRIINGIWESLPLEGVECTHYPHQPFDWRFGLTVAFFSLLFLTVVVSSLYHAWYHSPACHSRGYIPLDERSILGQEKPDGTGDPQGKEGDIDESEPQDAHIQRRPEGRALKMVNKILFSFALPQNLPRLLSGKLSEDSIACLHGIRVISMLWVILGHSFIFVAMIPMVNPLTALSWFSRYGFLTVINGQFAVDSFFVLSGLLVTYLTLKAMKKRSGRIPWRWFYFHRYLRLTPPLAITMLFAIYMMPYFGHGPLAQLLGNQQPCKDNWWKNILYINNCFNVVDTCIPWVWYLANDMQFFAISPLILIPLYHLPWLGMSFMAVLCFASFVVTGTLVGVNDFSLSTMEFMETGPGLFFDVVYAKPYCRITPYLVGMLLGYILYKYPKKSVKMQWPIALLGWILACGIGYTCIYCIYGNFNGHEWGLAASVIYETISRFAWGSALAWIIFACHYGYGGWVNSLLGHPAWAPLSRLTYCAYLLHPLIIFLYMSHQGTAVYMSLALTAFRFAGVSLITYGCAALFTLIVEFPLVNLEKLFIPRA